MLKGFNFGFEVWVNQGRIQDFKLGGGAHLKKIAPSGGRREHFWDISCEKSRFYAKKIIFFPILGGGARSRVHPPPWIHPWVNYFKKIFVLQINRENIFVSKVVCPSYTVVPFL
jgi:hypothetical protein